MIRKLIIALGTMFLAAAPSAQALPGLDVGISIGTATRAPSGTLQYQGGTNTDLKDTLNLGDHSDLTGRLKVKHAIPLLPNFYIDYLPMSFSGDKTNTTTVTYGGQTFQANTSIHTELTLNSVDIGLFYDIPFISAATAGIIQPEIGLNARLLSFKGSLTGTVGGVANTTQEKTASIPVPMLYLALGVYPIDLISANAQIKTLSVGGNTLTEWGVEVAVHPIPVFFLAAGYSAQQIKLDSNDIKTDISFKGPYIAIGAEF